MLVIFMTLFSLVQAQTDQEDGMSEMQDQMMQLQKQMEDMMKGFGNQEDGNSFFFLDTTIINEFGAMPMDSLMQGFSHVFPGMGTDSMMLKGFDLNGGMFGEGFQDQLNQMFKSLDDFGPDMFMDMEELMRQLEQNGIRPDDQDIQPRKPGQKKKKVYKI